MIYLEYRFYQVCSVEIDSLYVVFNKPTKTKALTGTRRSVRMMCCDLLYLFAQQMRKILQNKIYQKQQVHFYLVQKDRPLSRPPRLGDLLGFFQIVREPCSKVLTQFNIQFFNMTNIYIDPDRVILPFFSSPIAAGYNPRVLFLLI